MTEATRLFDCIKLHLEKAPIEDMMAAKENGTWRKYSTSEINDLVQGLSAGLLQLGISAADMTAEKREKVAILSKNRPEWIMLDLAVQQIGAVLAPIYPTITVTELEYILNDSEVRYVFVNDQELFHKVLSIRGNVPTLVDIFTFEHVVNAKHWKSLIQPVSPKLS